MRYITRKLNLLAAAAAVLFAAPTSGSEIQQPAQYRQEPAPLTAHKITGRIYEVRGGSGANAGFIITDNEVLVVDAKMTVESAQDMLAAIRGITDLPITKLLITHSDGDHINGIPGFPPEINIFAQGNSLKYMGDVLVQQEEDSPIRIGETFSRQLDIYSGSTRVRLLHFGPAHTEGDAVVYIPSEKVAFLGDLIFIGRDPLIHAHKNGSSLGLVNVLKSVLDLDADIFLHGHGMPVGKREIREFVEALVKKQEDIRALIRDGKTLEEIKAVFNVEDPPARPGRTPRPSLVEIIYTEIKGQH